MKTNQYNNNMKEEDFEYIKQHYQEKSVKELAKDLNKCTTTIYKAISKLNLKYDDRDGKPWTNDEIEFLKENYLKYSYRQLGLKLSRSKQSVEGKAHFLGLKKGTTKNCWTDEEIQFLKDNINSKTYDEIAKHINRSRSSIYNKVFELNLIDNEYKKHRKLKKDQIDFIKENYLKYTDKDMAIMFEVSDQTIQDVRSQYGLKKTGNEISGPTYIEKIVKNILDDLKIDYIYQASIGEYLPDFYIPSKNLIIEVQGDYFHCNPYIYKDGPKDNIQIKHILKDYTKKCFYLSHNYKLLEIWEKDINENLQNIKDIIKTAVYG